jgi:hypothetical protein
MALDEAGQDQFKAPVNHRAGYGTLDEKVRRLIDWITRHPDATLASGEGGLLLRRIQELETELHDLRRRNPDAHHTPY